MKRCLFVWLFFATLPIHSQAGEPLIFVSFREAVSEDAEIDVIDFVQQNQGNHEKGRAFTLRSEEELIAALSRPPGEERPRISVLGLFTDPQFQLMIRSLAKTKGIKVLETPSLMTRSGLPGISQHEGRRYGVIPTASADQKTVHLKAFLPPHGKAMNASRASTVSVEIPDGQTLVILERNEDGSDRVVFFTVRLMKPDGAPLEDSQTLVDRYHKTSSVSKSEPKRAPDHRSHLVKAGENLASIALQYQTSVTKIREINHLNSNRILVGQLLLIPTANEPRTTPPPVEMPTFSPLQDVLADTVIPDIDFTNVPLRDALDEFLTLLKQQAHGEEETLESISVAFDGSSPQYESKITLKLRTVPASEALRYLTILAQCRYQLTENIIHITTLE